MAIFEVHGGHKLKGEIITNWACCKVEANEFDDTLCNIIIEKL